MLSIAISDACTAIEAANARADQGGLAGSARNDRAAKDRGAEHDQNCDRDDTAEPAPQLSSGSQHVEKDDQTDAPEGDCRERHDVYHFQVRSI